VNLGPKCLELVQVIRSASFHVLHMPLQDPALHVLLLFAAADEIFHTTHQVDVSLLARHHDLRLLSDTQRRRRISFLLYVDP